MKRLTARTETGHAYLVNVKPDEQEVDSPHKNTLQCILDCFERLAQYEDLEEQGRLVVLPENWSVGMINRIMSLCERVRAMRIAKGKDDSPIITWQLYNMLAKSTRAEAEAALKGADNGN